MAATIKIKFDLTAGFLCRDRVKQDLENSKAKLKHWYPECHVLLTENKDWLIQHSILKLITFQKKLSLLYASGRNKLKI